MHSLREDIVIDHTIITIYKSSTWMYTALFRSSSRVGAGASRSDGIGAAYRGPHNYFLKELKTDGHDTSSCVRGFFWESNLKKRGPDRRANLIRPHHAKNQKPKRQRARHPQAPLSLIVYHDEKADLAAMMRRPILRSTERFIFTGRQFITSKCSCRSENSRASAVVNHPDFLVVWMTATASHCEGNAMLH